MSKNKKNKGAAGGTDSATATMPKTPKVKTRETAGERVSAFNPNQVTSFERSILGALGSEPALTSAIADQLGVTVNRVSGSVSVLLAKGLVTTSKTKQGTVVSLVEGVDVSQLDPASNGRRRPAEQVIEDWSEDRKLEYWNALSKWKNGQ